MFPEDQVTTMQCILLAGGLRENAKLVKLLERRLKAPGTANRGPGKG